jgi:hypothetical protein
VATDLGRNAVPSGVIMGDLAESIMRFRALQPSAILAPYAKQKALIAQQRIENLAEIQAEFLAYGPTSITGKKRIQSFRSFRWPGRIIWPTTPALQAPELIQRLAATFTTLNCSNHSSACERR